MPEFVYVRPTPQPEGMRALVVYLYDGRLVPAEGMRVIVDRHVRMLIATGDVELVDENSAQPSATADQPTKPQRKVSRAEEPS